MAFNPQFWSSGGGFRGISRASKSEKCASDDNQSIVPAIVKKINKIENSIKKLFEKTFRLQTEINKKIGSIIAGQNVNVHRVGDTVTISAVGGGGSGTSDYTELENKPSINDVVLLDNKSLTDLGIQFKTNRIKLDLSEYTLSNPLILTTLSTGAYDVVADGYITVNGTASQKRKVMQGSILITNGSFCFFVDDTAIPYIINMSDDVSGWGFFELAEKEYILSLLEDYLTKVGAELIYQPILTAGEGVDIDDNVISSHNGEWETIKTITFAEDTASVSITTDNLNRAFAIKKIRILINGSATTERIDCQFDNIVNTMFYYAMRSGTNVGYTILEIGESIDGARFCSSIRQGYGTPYTLINTNNQYYSGVTKNKDDADENTTTISLAVNSGVFKEGTKIILQGVK